MPIPRSFDAKGEVGDAMPRMLQNAIAGSRGNYCKNGKALKSRRAQNVAMAKKKRKTKKGDHFLKQWREYRDMTQEELAAAAGTNASVISLLETGERGLSNKWLERLAPILKTKKGFILDVDPHGAPAAILDIWGDIPTEDQPHAIKVLETFKKRA